MAALNFNASAVAPVTMDSQYVPTNWYGMRVVESEIKPTKDTQGTILSIVLEILTGKYKGYRINENFNVQNKNEKAQKIGQGLLSTLCHATAQLNLQDSRQLHGISFYGKLRLDPPEGTYQPKNTLINAKGMDAKIELVDLELPVFDVVKVAAPEQAFVPGATPPPSFPGSAGVPTAFPGVVNNAPAPSAFPTAATTPFPGTGVAAQAPVATEAPAAFPSAVAHTAAAPTPAFAPIAGTATETPPWAQ